MSESKTSLPVLDEGRRAFPRREKQAVAPELDQNGDVIFRFKIDPSRATQTLEEFYRESLLDLLKIVRLYSAGRPVIVDGFAFLNAPHDVISLVAKPASSEPDRR